MAKRLHSHIRIMVVGLEERLGFRLRIPTDSFEVSEV